MALVVIPIIGLAQATATDAHSDSAGQTAAGQATAFVEKASIEVAENTNPWTLDSRQNTPLDGNGSSYVSGQSAQPAVQPSAGGGMTVKAPATSPRGMTQPVDLSSQQQHHSPARQPQSVQANGSGGQRFWQPQAERFVSPDFLDSLKQQQGYYQSMPGTRQFAAPYAPPQQYAPPQGYAPPQQYAPPQGYVPSQQYAPPQQYAAPQQYVPPQHGGYTVPSSPYQPQPYYAPPTGVPGYLPQAGGGIYNPMSGAGSYNPYYDVPAVTPWGGGADLIHRGGSLPGVPDAAIGGIPPMNTSIYAPSGSLRRSPGGFMPGSSMPGPGMPGSVMPGSVMPGSVMPGSVMPGSVMPGSGMPGGVTPGGMMGDMGGDVFNPFTFLSDTN